MSQVDATERFVVRLKCQTIQLSHRALQVLAAHFLQVHHDTLGPGVELGNVADPIRIDNQDAVSASSSLVATSGIPEVIIGADAVYFLDRILQSMIRVLRITMHVWPKM